MDITNLVEVMNDKIKLYDNLENKADVESIYPANRAFKPAAFNQANFPTRVRCSRELVKFSDMMNELDNRKYYFEDKKYSGVEIELMKAVGKNVLNKTGALGRPVTPYMSLFPPIDMLRVIGRLPSGSGLRILEVGPGSGYLGSYLISAPGIKYNSFDQISYCSVDCTQSLYLWQYLMFDMGVDVVDYSESLTIPKPFCGNMVEMLPWWHFVKLYEYDCSADVVICDAALGEMDAFAAYYVIRLAEKMLDKSNIGAFAFRHIGEPRFNNIDGIKHILKTSGFVYHTNIDGVNIFSINEIKLKEDKQDYKYSAKGNIRVDKLNDNYKFFDFLKLIEWS